MSSKRWAGFTDEDIERIKSNPEVNKSCTDELCDFEGITKTSKKRGPMKIKSIPAKTAHEYSDDMYDDNSSFCKRNTKELSSSINEDKNSFDTSNEDCVSADESHCTCNSYGYQDIENDTSMTENITVSDIACENDKNKSDETNESNANLPPLEIFEMRQKRIEEENARRRALINKAINDKKMRTHAEAIKLAKITHELNRIDSNLSSDVSILRNYIERASIEFAEAEKRYLKAEKEFVEAKLFLFDKMQRKELLTEHLCAIIEQNENRKADKLVELMKQLEMDVLVDDYGFNGLEPILPNLCALNEESYHSCQTIKPNLSKGHSQEKMTEPDQKEDCQENIPDTQTVDNLSDSTNTMGSSSAEGT